MENYEKRYKEALERAKIFKSPYCQHAAEVIFPELRESEDERIRKEIISFIIDRKNWFPKEETKASWIAWLEKQGENTYDYKRVNLDKFDDRIRDFSDMLEDKPKPYWDGWYEAMEWVRTHGNPFEKQGEQKPAPKFKIGDTIHKIGEVPIFLRNIEKIEDGYYVCNSSHSFVNIRFQDDYELVEQKSSWSEEDEKLYISALWHIKNSCGNDGKDSGEYEVYNWLKSIKNRVQPTQEWSEEDKKIMKRIDNLLYSQCTIHGSEYEELHNWLKSLKSNHWKPSEYDISLLEEIARNIRNNIRPFCSEVSALEALIENLKKL